MKMRLFVVLAILCSTLPAVAQNIIQFNYSLNNTYSHVEGALLSKQLLKDEFVNYRFLVIASISYVDDPLIVKDITLNQRESVLVSNYTTFNFGVGFHVARNFLIGVMSGYTKATLNGFNTSSFILNGFEDEETALTDSKIIAKWRLTPDDKNYAVALIPNVTLPTGAERSFTTDNSAGFGIDLAFEKIISDNFQIAANIGYYHSPDAFFQPITNGPINLDYTDKVHTAIGAYIPFSDDFGANLEYTRYWIISSDDQNPNELYGGLRWQAAQPLALFAGAAFGNLDSTKDSNDFKFSAGLKFHGGGYGPARKRIAADIDAINDSVVVPYGQSMVIDNLQNDLITDPGVGYLKIVSNSHPRETKCSVIKSPLSVRYTPIKNFVGKTVCRYEYCTSNGICDQADIFINVQKGLKAIDDVAVVPFGQSAIISALQNDSLPRPANGYLRIVSNSMPNKTKCSIVKSPLAVRYTPTAKFVGTSICRYEYCTASKVCDQADIHITVKPPRIIAAEPYGNLVWNKSIYFCNDCDFLNKRSLEVTRELKSYLREKGGRIAKIVIEGHTSLVASKAYNLALSKRRSRNTYKQLRKLGVPANLMEMVAYGEGRPEIKSFETHKKHPTNRRVEFRIYEKTE